MAALLEAIRRRLGTLKDGEMLFDINFKWETLHSVPW
jgi:hypothetical protein